MRRVLKAIPFMVMPLALAGCFSTGSGGNVANPVSFSGFSSMKSPGTTKIGGVGNEVSLASSGGAVVAASGLETGKGVTVDLRTNEDGVIDGVAVSGPKTISSWNAYAYDPKGDQMALSAEDGGNSVYMMPPAAGFEYQTFGVWQTGQGAASGTAGSFSAGSRTTDSMVASMASSQTDPAAGPVTTAAFRGYALGTYVDEAGKQFVTSAQADLTADLAGGAATFTTSHTSATALGGSGSNPAPGLDLAGNLAWGGTNAISGTVTAANQMTGTVNGAFYGPAAEEVGGVFALQGSGPQTYVGGFGTKKQ